MLYIYFGIGFVACLAVGIVFGLGWTKPGDLSTGYGGNVGETIFGYVIGLIGWILFWPIALPLRLSRERQKAGNPGAQVTQSVAPAPRPLGFSAYLSRNNRGLYSFANMAHSPDDEQFWFVLEGGPNSGRWAAYDPAPSSVLGAPLFWVEGPTQQSLSIVHRP